MKGKFVCLIAMFLAVGCSSKSVDEGRADEPLVGKDYKLSADREAFAKIREQVPEEKRGENDEIAFLQQMMADPKVPPARVRERFNRELSKKRDAFNKDLKSRREGFVRKERSEREAFQREQKAQRELLRGRSVPKDRKKAKSDELEAARKEFYSAQRDRRDSFEADIRDRRKNFEDYAREVSADFNQQYKNYLSRFEEAEKAGKEEERKSLDSFKKMDEVPASPLGTGS